MTEAVTVALISGLCVAVPSVITTMFSNNKANTLMKYRIDELTKKVEKHNNVVERMALQERETKAIWKRIDEIKEELDTTIQVEEYFDTVEYDYPNFHLSMECFICTILEGNLTLLEHESAKWLTKDTLDLVDWLPADLGLIAKLKEIL